MRTRHNLRKGLCNEHLRLVFGDVSAGSGGGPPPSGGGCTNLGALGNICDVAKLVWQVEAEYNVWSDPGFSVPAVAGDHVTRWDDLTGGGRHLFPFVTGPGGYARYQTGATSTGKPDIQVGIDFNSIFGGNFNFFTAAGKWSYAIIFRSLSQNGALIDDGTPLTNGFAMGVGQGTMDNTGSVTVTELGIKDGAHPTEDTATPKTIIGALIATYDGTSSGATNYYWVRKGQGAEPPVVVVGPVSFSNLGITATGGFAIGGTYLNADPNRQPQSLSLEEAAVWQGLLSNANITQIGTQILTYWGLS